MPGFWFPAMLTLSANADELDGIAKTMYICTQQSGIACHEHQSVCLRVGPAAAALFAYAAASKLGSH